MINYNENVWGQPRTFFLCSWDESVYVTALVLDIRTFLRGYPYKKFFYPYILCEISVCFQNLSVSKHKKDEGQCCPSSQKY